MGHELRGYSIQYSVMHYYAQKARFTHRIRTGCVMSEMRLCAKTDSKLRKSKARSSQQLENLRIVPQNKVRDAHSSSQLS